jgi:hypothetical protein
MRAFQEQEINILEAEESIVKTFGISFEVNSPFTK